MDVLPEFTSRLSEMPILFNRLRQSPSLAIRPVSKFPSSPAIYAIFEDDVPLYTGRTKNLRQRMQNHTSGRAEQSAFAFKLARELSGKNVASYKPQGSRKDLLKDKHFADALLSSTQRVRAMQIRFVEIEDYITQHMLEVYCALAFNTPYNEFKTS